jgi:hypothetical protein
MVVCRRMDHKKNCYSGREPCGALTEKARVLYLIAVGSYSATRRNSVINMN